MAAQFIREESFSNKGGKPGRKGGKKVKDKSGTPRRSAEEILAELMRLELNCKHVPNPQKPLFIAGSTEGIAEAVAYPKRWDTRVLLGAVASWPERWDQCDPVRVAEWAVRVREYAEMLWGSKVAAIAMHLDEAHPHIHIILHDRGKTVKPFSPGFAAGDRAAEAALALGMSKGDANCIRHAEYRRGERLWLDHYHRHVGSQFGMTRIGLDPKPRGPRVSALELRAIREWDDPLDLSLAAANGESVSKLLAREVSRPLPRPGGSKIDVLASIGFVPETDYPALVKRVREEEIALNLSPAAARLQRKLLRILRAKPDWTEFAKQCRKREIDLIFRRKDSVVVGITFRHAGQAYSGSKLGKKFSWPVLSRNLAFDPFNDAHISTLDEMDLRAQSARCVLERVEVREVNLAPGKPRRGPKPVALTETTVADGVAYCWGSGRVAIKVRKASFLIIDPAPDVVIFAIMTALKRGWRALRLTGPAKALKHCAKRAIQVARELGVLLEVALDQPVVRRERHRTGGRLHDQLGQPVQANQGDVSAKEPGATATTPTSAAAAQAPSGAEHSVARTASAKRPRRR